MRTINSSIISTARVGNRSLLPASCGGMLKNLVLAIVNIYDSPKPGYREEAVHPGLRPQQLEARSAGRCVTDGLRDFAQAERVDPLDIGQVEHNHVLAAPDEPVHMVQKPLVVIGRI